MGVSLSNTPNEVLALIAEQVGQSLLRCFESSTDTSPFALQLHKEGQKGALASLSSTSKLFPEQLAVWLYRSIELDFSIYDIVWSARKLNALHKSATYRHYVRGLTVTCGKAKNETDHLTPCFPLIAKLIRQLGTLQSFSWHSFQNIPPSIFKALHEHGNIKTLDLQFYHCRQTDLATALLKGLKGLEGTPKLRAALLELSADNLEDNKKIGRDPKTTRLNRAIVQAPLLETLTLRIASDIVRYANEDSSLLRPSPRDNMLQSLVNLKIYGRSATLHEDFVRAIPSYNLRHLELLNCGDCSTLLHIFSNQSQELQLHTLKIVGSFSDWPGILEGVAVVESFLVSFEGLEELVLEGYGAIQMAAIAWHYRTLRSLSLIDVFDFVAPPGSGNNDYHMVPPTREEKARKLKQVRDCCPNLCSLRINDHYIPLNRCVSSRPTHNLQSLNLPQADPVANVLSSFTKLHFLTLNLAEPQATQIRDRDVTTMKVKDDYSEMEVYNMTRNVAPRNLKWLRITDEAPPKDETLFVDVTGSRHDELYHCSVFWHIDCTKSPSHLTNVLLTPAAYQEKRLTRLAKSMILDYHKPDSPAHERLVRDVLDLAESRRTSAVKAISKGKISRKGQTKVLDTLGFEGFDGPTSPYKS